MKAKKTIPVLGILDDVAMVFLALVSAGLLVLEYTTPLTLAQMRLIDTIDISIACIFLGEFVINFFRAPDKKTYFKKHWWELLASIPVTTPGTQALRLLRFLRLVRLLRLNSGLRHIFDYLAHFTSETHMARVTAIWLLIAASSAAIFYGLEHLAHTPTLTLFDCVWWSVSTMSTVGYGDIYPLTTGGRILSMILMITGVGATGIFTALVASFFLKDK